LLCFCHIGVGQSCRGKAVFEEEVIMKNTTKTFVRAITCVACLIAAPLSAVAQDQRATSPLLIDVFQDGSLYITYDEYLERQRRVQQARVTNQAAAPLVLPTRRITGQAQVARNSSVMELRDQWQIGAFR
jgi:hypothetical protein